MKKPLFPFLHLLCLLFLYSNSNSQHLKQGIDTVSTINSFEAVGEFYKMDYSGDYSELLDMLDDHLAGTDSESFEEFECSLFSALGDPGNQLFGRNFDNPDNDVLLTRYNPPDGYASLAFTRMSDLGFSNGTNYNNLTFEQKLPFLNAAYFVPDGINEYGLAAGLATVDAVSYTLDPTKDTIFVTRLIREILDRAQTVDDALAIANSYNVFDMSVNTLSHHVHIGSANGESVTLEFAEGEFKAVNTDSAWQILTNIPVYNIPHLQLMSSCWRYNSLYTELQENDGILTWREGMDALDQVHINCPWSAIYDLNNRSMYIAIDNNYDDIAYTDLEDFSFVIFVNINSYEPVDNKSNLSQNYPNPFSSTTNIGFTVDKTTNVEISVFDTMGRKIKELVNERFVPGSYEVTWNRKNDGGEVVSPGTYLCTQRTDTGHNTIQMIIGSNSEY